MPLIQGGPPEWIWERTADLLKPELVPVRSLEGHTVYGCGSSCGMEILRVQFLTREDRELSLRFAVLREQMSDPSLPDRGIHTSPTLN
jgi:hypothetical protein